MVDYKSLKVGNTIYVIETGPVVLQLDILDIFSVDGVDRIKVKGPDLTFEVDFKDVSIDTYFELDEARANATKNILKQVNELIKDISDDGMNDYFDLDKEVERYKNIFPELFI